MTHARLISMCLLMLGTVLALRAAEVLTEDDVRWRDKVGFNPQVHGTVPQSSDFDVIARAPYAYYPSTNQLEVIFDLAAAMKLLPAGTAAPATPPAEVQVQVTPQAGGARLASLRIPLDARGRGHGLFTLPKLPAGVYRVDYEFGGITLPASRTFRRTDFGFEGCTYGTEHKVYAPFLPVTVEGAKLSMVDRTYTVNALGLFDSVVSKGRELLAAPIALKGETADGTPIVWQTVRAPRVTASHPDQAIISAESRSQIATLNSQMSVEEDGCAKITWTLTPAATPATIKRLWLEIALKESEAPLCHLVGMNSMRHNYAGAVPRGGEITWLNQAWRPARFMVEPFTGPAPASYQVWEAKQQMHWGSQRWSFAPYIWLGGEERGLAWFGDHTAGYSPDGTSSLQRLLIEPGKVVLRVELIQKPIVLDAPRTLEFGLQASPTKPMPDNWRRYDVPGGGGMPVVVWGGFNCSSKYPVNKDWSLVDKIVEGRGSGKVDTGFFDALIEKHGLQHAKANGEPWRNSVLHFAGKEATNPHPNGTTVYFEEHQTNGDKPEMIEYMDEWADTTWSRFRYFAYSGWHQTPRMVDKTTWGPEVRSANSANYRDFAVFMANEWMRRGVGIYYDNTYPMTDYNRQHFAGRNIVWSSSIWGHRDYYRRVWKRSRELMAQGLTPLDPLYAKTDPTRRMRLHIVGHVTNCQVLPYTTWWDASLGVESPGQWQPEPPLSPAAMKKSLDEWGFAILPGPSKDKPGHALPYPPDYLRAMEGGRMAGLIPYYRHLLRSEDAFGGIGIGYGSTAQGQDPVQRAHRLLSDVGMGLVHEIRGGAGGYEQPMIATLRRTVADFSRTPGAKLFNYWEEKPFATVGNPAVKWLAMTREGKFFGLLLLQSYSPDALATRVKFPDGTFFVDALTREQFTADGKGEATISLAADYGTRALLVARRPGDVTLLPTTTQTRFVEDFELGLGTGATIKGGAVTVVDDPLLPGNRILHLIPGHPAQNLLTTQVPALGAEGDYTITCKFRLPQPPKGAGKQGLLRVGYRLQKGMRYGFELGLTAAATGAVTFWAETPRLVYDGGKSQPMHTTTIASGGKPLGNPKLAITDWHVLLIRVIGTRHVLALDGTVFYAGDDATSLGGDLELAPGWGLSSGSPVPSVDVDDLWMVQTKEDKAMLVTSSWDDGHKNDIRVAALLRKYGGKGTFFLYPENYVLQTKDPAAALKIDPFLIPMAELVPTYQGMEVGAHGYGHPDMRKLTPEALTIQLTESKRVLEGWFQTPIVGMAYPYGAYSPAVQAAVKAAGYTYARTVSNAPAVAPVTDPYALNVSLHAKSPQFWQECERVQAAGGVFYFWGHSHEFRTEEEWRVFEERLARISADPSVTWVTNRELVERAAK
jgi:peptidoglycan/xylan/chitin deacetylase (PgdA/CDA1 family)